MTVTKTQKLEQLVVKDGEFFNKKGIIVSPHPIGLPEIMHYDFFNNKRVVNENELDENLSIRVQQYEKIPEDATHYVVGEVVKELNGNKMWKHGDNQTGFDFTIQFYRI